MSLLTVLISAIAVGAAVLGPLYLRTAGDSVLRTAVTAAPIEARGATLSAFQGGASSLGPVQRAEQVVEAAGGLRRWYGTPITSIITGVRLVGPGPSPLQSQLFARTGICGVVHFQQGSCDLASGDVGLSARSARELRVSLGAVLEVGVVGRSAPLPLRVTGIYSVPDLSLRYWWDAGPGYFPFGHTAGPDHIPQLDSLIASPATALAVPVQAVPFVVAQVPLRAGRVSLGGERALQQSLSGATRTVTAHGISLSTQLPALLAATGHQLHVMSTIVAIAAVQLVLLAIWVLGSLLARSSDARRSEMRVARLRGFPPVSMLAATAAEPAALCLLGMVVGVAVAWGVVVLARNRLLDPAAAIAPDRWVFAALALTVLAIAGVLGVGAMRLLRSSGLSEGRTGVGGTVGRTSLAADAVLLVLSLVALVALGTGGAFAGHANPIAAAAPGLVALGAAVLAARLVLFACRWGVSASAYSERVATFLALRQIVRRPVVLRQARVLIIALGLACFAASAWSVARANRASAAAFRVGTTAVVTVTPHGVGLEQAVDRLDPRGHFAMAAVTMRTQSSTLLAVDARRLPAAASWPPGISPATVSGTSRALDPAGNPAVTLPDAPLRLAASTTATGRAAARLRDLDLALWVFSPVVGTTIVNLGALHSGTRTYRASLAYVCPGGCRLAGLGVLPAPYHRAPASGTIDVTVDRVSTSPRSAAPAVVPADLSPGGWRATAGGVVIARPAGGGLSFAIPAGVAATYAGAVGSLIAPMASPADHPMVLPGAVTTDLESINGASAPGSQVPSQGLDGNTLFVRPAVTASALPGVGSDAVMVDLDLLERSQVGPTTADATDQVWLGQGTPAHVLERLQAVGLHVDSVQRASTVVAQMGRSGPAFADDFLLAATIAALLAAAASTLGALGANSRQRATELTAFEVGGIPRRTLARSLAVESGVLAVTALFGAGAGVLAAILAVPSLPELAAPSPIPLQYGLPGGLVTAVSAAVVVVVLLAAAAVAAILLRRMSPLLLRTAPNDSAG